ncbi:MAG TPA: YdcF family protein, partial [Candidatus Saccharimonadales bacterium]
LYKAGWAKYIIFSGAAFDEASPSNAAVMKQQAVDAGVPETSIITEDTSRTTHQNAEQTSKLLKEYGISRLIVVTSPYHQRRAGLEFKAIAGSEVAVLNHPAWGDPDWQWYWWATPRGWWLAIGELAKVGATHAGESQ